MTPMMEEKKKQRHPDGASDGREEEAGMLSSRTSSDGSRASIILATIAWERMVPAMGNLSVVAPKI